MHERVHKKSTKISSVNDRAVSRLSKKLHLKKNSKIPDIFYAEGYGDILDVCDSILGKIEEKYTEESDTNEIDSDDIIIEEHEEEIKKISKFQKIIKHEQIETIPSILMIEKPRDFGNLKKSIKMLFNKLSDKNLNILINEFKSTLSTYGINDTLTEFATSAISCAVQPNQLPDRILLIYTTFISCLHFIIGNELLTCFLQSLIENFNKCYISLSINPLEKECQNSIVIICILFFMNNIGFGLLKDLIHKFIDSFTEQDIEMLLLILKYCGFEIRKKEIVFLKDFIKTIHDTVKKQPVISIRASFMLEMITAIQHNNPSKITDYDPLLFESFAKTRRDILKHYTNEGALIDVSLQLLSNTDASGKWWLSNATIDVGSKPNYTLGTKIPQKWDSDLLNIAKEQRYTDITRVNIFCTLVTSHSSCEAFRLLTALNLKSKDNHHIIRIVVETCLQEEIYNPFYYQVIKEFIDSHRSFSSTLQFCIWDQMRKLDELSNFNRSNLSCLMIDLFLSESIRFQIFKILNFNTFSYDKCFYLNLMSQIILKTTPAVLKSLFAKILDEKWAELKENIVFFLISNCEKHSPILQRLKTCVSTTY